MEILDLEEERRRSVQNLLTLRQGTTNIFRYSSWFFSNSDNTISTIFYWRLQLSFFIYKKIQVGRLCHHWKIMFCFWYTTQIFYSFYYVIKRRNKTQRKSLWQNFLGWNLSRSFFETARFKNYLHLSKNIPHSSLDYSQSRVALENMSWEWI